MVYSRSYRKGVVILAKIELQEILEVAVSKISYEFDEDTYSVDVIGGISISESALKELLGPYFYEDVTYDIADEINDASRVVTEYIQDADDRYVGLTEMVYDWEAQVLDNNEIWVSIEVVDFRYDPAERISYILNM